MADNLQHKHAPAAARLCTRFCRKRLDRTLLYCWVCRSSPLARGCSPHHSTMVCLLPLFPVRFLENSIFAFQSQFDKIRRLLASFCLRKTPSCGTSAASSSSSAAADAYSATSPSKSSTIPSKRHSSPPPPSPSGASAAGAAAAPSPVHFSPRRPKPEQGV